MKNIFWKRERIEIMTALALFNYVFLGAEYLFDNMMAFQTDSGGVVLAQSYVLGSSTIGFLLFGVLDGRLRERAKKAGSAGAGVLAAVCLWVIQVHQRPSSSNNDFAIVCYLHILFYFECPQNPSYIHTSTCMT